MRTSLSSIATAVAVGLVVMLAGTSLATVAATTTGALRNEPPRPEAASTHTPSTGEDATDEADSGSVTAERGRAFGTCMQDLSNGETGWERRLACDALHPGRGRGLAHGQEEAEGLGPGRGQGPPAGGPPGLLRKAARDAG